MARTTVDHTHPRFPNWRSGIAFGHVALLGAMQCIAQVQTWHQISVVPSPSARVSHCMAYDSARQRIVMFGGNSNGLVLADTWEWDGSNWVQRNPVTSPPARAEFSMAYDSLRQRVVVFGGV